MTVGISINCAGSGIRRCATTNAVTTAEATLFHFALVIFCDTYWPRYPCRSCQRLSCCGLLAGGMVRAKQSRVLPQWSQRVVIISEAAFRFCAGPPHFAGVVTINIVVETSGVGYAT